MSGDRSGQLEIEFYPSLNGIDLHHRCVLANLSGDVHQRSNDRRRCNQFSYVINLFKSQAGPPSFI